MSRALDKETTAALQRGDPKAAFAAIADVLTGPADQEAAAPQARLEIEFLGREHPPLPKESAYVLRDGCAVAVPKLALVQAFFVARTVLQQHQRSAVPASCGGGGGDESGANGDDDTATRRLLRATAVVLLMDPEHLTAANTRKRILQKQIQRQAQSGSGAAVQPTLAALAKEMHLVDSLLTSHLHRHTKSPTLWNHRRWLVSVLLGLASDNSVRSSSDALQDITEVVMVAAVRHPRNYYAWDHARWLVRQQRQSRQHGGRGHRSDEQDAAAARQLVVAVRDWCYRNHTDTSGWSFLLSLLDEASPQPGMLALFAETVGQVEQMAASLRWTGESVWVFLRTAVAQLVANAEAGDSSSALLYNRFRDTALSLQRHVGPTEHAHRVLQQAQDWCARELADRPRPRTG